MTTKHTGKLVIAVDRTSPGSEGRLCLLLPVEFSHLIGKRYRAVGHFTNDGALMLVENQDGNTITPRRQYWWKNGVRDHGVRENWEVEVYEVVKGLLVVVLVRPSGDPAPVLPPHQDLLFHP